MEDFKRKNGTDGDKEIVFSKAIKAGKRIYYLDVRKNRKDEMFLAITESKKVISEGGDAPQVSFEKHKIFLYKEDFAKFMNGMQEVMNYVEKEQGEPLLQPRNVDEGEDKDAFPTSNEIKIDIDF